MKAKTYTAQEIATYQAANPVPHRKILEAQEGEAEITRRRERLTALRESKALRYRSIGL